MPGALPAAIGANAMGKGLICPAACGPEAAWAGEDVDVLAAPHLLSLVNHFKGLQTLARPKPNLERDAGGRCPTCATCKGQESAKRALEIAAAGGHNLLMIGPPGSGKSMLAARLPSILPPLSPGGDAGGLDGALARRRADGRQARAPSGRSARRTTRPAWRRWSAAARGRSPGEVSLAHLGVLFLDELPEFQPERARRAAPAAGDRRDRHRARQSPHRLSVAHPAGRRHEPVPVRRRRAGREPASAGRAAPPTTRRASRGRCSTASTCRSRCRPSRAADLVLPPPAEGSAEVRARVTAARERQRARFAALGAKGVRTNAECSGRCWKRSPCRTRPALALLRQASDTLQLSARGFHRTLRVARTLADLDGSDAVARLHVAEALSYRGETLRQRAARKAAEQAEAVGSRKQESRYDPFATGISRVWQQCNGSCRSCLSR